MSDDLTQMLESGCTTLARAWRLERRDGVVMGFTDHDLPLRFDGLDYLPETGLTARAFASSTGLSVDNSEAVGALSSEAISEADIAAGRYDGAEVTVWQVNWAAPAQRRVVFRGHMGEVTRAAGGFTAELRGLADGLNHAQGRVYHPRCAAALGDGQCRADLDQPGMSAEAVLSEVDGASLVLADLGGFDDGWFRAGRLSVLDGAGQGLVALIRADRLRDGGSHELELWQPLGAAVAPGDRVKLLPGCDKSAETCRLKFGNLLNFRGFPHIPGEDWLMAVPARRHD